jgi:hypothetical protein
MNILVTFAVSIIFGLYLPTFDSGSDVFLMYNTITFNLGNTIELAGCRACFGYSPHLNQSKHSSSCKTCVTDGKGQNGYYCGAFSQTIDKINAFQKNDSCEEATEIKYDNNKETFEPGNCYSLRDNCCITHVKSKIESLRHKKEKCDSIDACTVHIRYLSKLTEITNINIWKQSTEYDDRRRVGGEICNLLTIYGAATAIPLILNTFFHLVIFVFDLKAKRVNILEVVFVFFQFYPQWRVIKFLSCYVINRDKNKLEEDVLEYDSSLSTIEPFAEAVLQV